MPSLTMAFRHLGWHVGTREAAFCAIWRLSPRFACRRRDRDHQGTRRSASSVLRAIENRWPAFTCIIRRCRPSCHIPADRMPRGAELVRRTRVIWATRSADIRSKVPPSFRTLVVDPPRMTRPEPECLGELVRAVPSEVDRGVPSV